MYFSRAYHPDCASPSRLVKAHRTLLESIECREDAVLIVDSEGKVICYNEHFLNMWDVCELSPDDWSRDELIEEISNELEPSEHGDGSAESPVGNREDRTLLRTTDGRSMERWYRSVRSDDELLGEIWTFRDVTDYHKANEQVEFLAYHDQLTGLPNRSSFEEHAQEEFSTEASDQTKALFFIDLDRFNRVNVIFGDKVGDQLLQRVVNRWNQRLDPDWFLARTGGDEFCLIVQNLDNREHAASIAEDLLESLEEPFLIQGNELPARASIGVTLFPRHGQTHGELLNHARVAMNQSRRKHGRESNYEFFLPQSDRNNVNTILLESRLSQAISEEDLSLAYQPQIELDTGRIVGFEALLRWELEGYGSISPNTVIPVAEKSGLIVDLGRWVLQEACRQLSLWQQSVGNDLRMSVNLSARQLVEGKELLKDVETALNTCGLKPSCLELEVTESVALQDIGYARDMLEDRRDLDIRVSLDDFGTGQASLSYLTDLDFDAIKIDRAFIKNIKRTDRHRELVGTIVTLADKLDMDVVSEGVEEAYQMQVLKDLKCQYAQGYFIGRPQRVDQINQYLKKDSLLPRNGDSTAKVN